MSERKINLEDLFINHCNNNMLHWINEAEYRKSFLLDAMKDAIKQALELAAENAVVDIIDHEEVDIDELPTKNGVYVILPIYGVDKQSILDTINQIE